MKQVVQSIGSGRLRIIEVPTPTCGPAEVLVSTTCSLLSTGTEKAVRELASSSLIEKAKARPDLVRQVLKKTRTDGIRNTVRGIRSRLDEEMALGYSAAGVVLESGAAAANMPVGTRVATASAGHAEAQVVPALLAVPIPEGVSDEEAAFGAVAAIALQGLRQADVQPGGCVAVIGLGLVGQLTARIALASGLRVIGVDLRQWTVDLARAAGCMGLAEEGQDTTDAVLAASRGRGVDAVLVTASTKASGPVTAAVERVRDRGTIVIVGDVGVELNRTPFYMKEVDVRFARSYGPGRYERVYEEYGVDYPVGHVRWTEGRNIEAYLDLVSSGRLIVGDLITHTFDIDEAERAYATIREDPHALAVQFNYSGRPISRQPIMLKPDSNSGGRAGIIGAGNYAKMTFLPAMKAAEWAPARAVTSMSGLTARHLAERHGIGQVVADVPSLLGDSAIDTVFVLSRHDSHGRIACDALAAGKNVFVEKPLALSEAELDSILEVLPSSKKHLWGGFNRRHSDAIRQVKAALGASGEPLVITYRVSAGRLPETHWYKDRRQGGRLLGEVCHFLDLASWVVGMPATQVVAFGSGGAELLLQEDLLVSLRFADGSIATVTYAEHGHGGTSKERLDILGRGHTATIEDFRSLSIDGKTVKLSAPGKGHVENLRLFADVLAGKASGWADTRATIASTATSLAAVKSLQEGVVALVDPRVGQQPFN